MSMSRLHLLRGRLVLYVEPRDIWIGAYVAEDYVYVCLLPMLVIRWERSWSWGILAAIAPTPPVTAEPEAGR